MDQRITAATERDGEELGQGLVEYGLILVLISVVSIAIMTTIGGQITSLFTTVTSALSL